MWQKSLPCTNCANCAIERGFKRDSRWDELVWQRDWRLVHYILAFCFRCHPHVGSANGTKANGAVCEFAARYNPLHVVGRIGEDVRFGGGQNVRQNEGQPSKCYVNQMNEKENKTAMTTVDLSPTPNAMLDVWRLPVESCTEDGGGERESADQPARPAGAESSISHHHTIYHASSAQQDWHFYLAVVGLITRRERFSATMEGAVCFLASTQRASFHSSPVEMDNARFYAL